MGLFGLYLNAPEAVFIRLRSEIPAPGPGYQVTAWLRQFDNPPATRMQVEGWWICIVSSGMAQLEMKSLPEFGAIPSKIAEMSLKHIPLFCLFQKPKYLWQQKNCACMSLSQLIALPGSRSPCSFRLAKKYVKAECHYSIFL